MNDIEFIARVSQRVEQKSQGVKFPVDTVFSIRDTALQRLADKVAASDSWDMLYRAYPLVLSSGEITLQGLTPTLLLSKMARKHWLVTMTGVTYPIKPLPNYQDILNPPPISTYYYYTIRANALVIRNYLGAVVPETATILYGSYVPLINDTLFGTAAELTDDLIDQGVQLLLENSNPTETLRQAKSKEEGVK